MPAPSAAPPPAPAAAPKAPPKAAAPAAAPPKPSAVPAPPVERNDGPDADWMKGPGEEIDQMDGDHDGVAIDKPAPKREPKPPTPPPPAAEVEPDEVPGDESPAAPELPKPDVKAEDDGVISPDPDPEPERPMKAPELRKAYEENKRKIKEEFEPTIAKLQARVKELETAPPDHPDTEKYKAVEARNKELESMMSFIDYQQTTEFKDKYQKPYVEAWNKCLADISELTVEVPDGQGGYVTRAAKDIDVQEIAALPLGERVKRCNALFGDASPIVMEHVQEIIRTNNAQNRALDEAKQNANKRLQTHKTETQQQQETRVKLWKESNAALATKYPRWFAPAPGDTEGNKLLDAGFALTALAFPEGPIRPEQVELLPDSFKEEIKTKGQLSPENTVRLHALIRNRAANHNRLARQLKAAQAELAAAKKQLAAYEDSEPPSGSIGRPRASRTGEAWDEDPNREIDELDKADR